MLFIKVFGLWVGFSVFLALLIFGPRWYMRRKLTLAELEERKDGSS